MAVTLGIHVLVVEHLSSIHNVLCSIPSTTKKQTNKCFGARHLGQLVECLHTLYEAQSLILIIA